MKADLILHWGELPAWLGQNWKNEFSHTTVDFNLPKGSTRSFDTYSATIKAALPGTDSKGRWRPILNVIKQRGLDPDGVRVGVIGFSETCIGVRVLLASADSGLIDFVFANDGIHAGVDVFARFATLSARGVPSDSNIPQGERLFVVSHSQTAKPPAAEFSTAESAAELIKAVTKDFPYFQESVDIPELTGNIHSPPMTIAGVTYDSVPAWYQFHTGNMYVLGYKNLSKPGGTSDHIYQSKVIGPRVMRKIVIPRWNDNDPNSGSCVIA
jgi:hypothetical protein